MSEPLQRPTVADMVGCAPDLPGRHGVARDALAASTRDFLRVLGDLPPKKGTALDIARHLLRRWIDEAT